MLVLRCDVYNSYLSMQQQLRTKLCQTMQYCKILKLNFDNNVKVIQERQQQIQALQVQVQQLSNDKFSLQTHIQRIQDQHRTQVLQMESIFNKQLSEKEREGEQVAVIIESRARRQIQIATNKLAAQIQSFKRQQAQSQDNHRRLIAQNSRLTQMVVGYKNTVLQLQNAIQRITQQKNATNGKMQLHLQQLQGVRNCNQQWEEMLKGKLKEAQREKQVLQEELSEVKLAAKQKIKKIKEEMNKKVLAVSQQKEEELRGAVQEQKQLKFQLEKTLNEQRNSSGEIITLREEKSKLEMLLNKQRQAQMKTTFERNQKEYDYLLKIFEQDKRDLKAQIEALTQQHKLTQDELADVNSKRESFEKAVQRLKVQLLNKAKENDQLKKDYKKIKHQLQAKVAQHQAIPVRQTQTKPPRRLDALDSVKMQQDYSQVFTEDMGYIDDKFFDVASGLKSPKGKMMMGSSNPGRDAQLMKKIAQLQLQCQQYKNLVKGMRQQADGMRRMCQQQKNKEVSLFRDKANIYWEKANDKQQQLMMMRQQYNQLKTTLSEVTSQLKQLKSIQVEGKFKDKTIKQQKQLSQRLQIQNQQLKEQLQALQSERAMLEDVSAQLRAEVHALRHPRGQPSMQFTQNSIEHQPLQIIDQQTQPYGHRYRLQQNSSQMQQVQGMAQAYPLQRKIPKKLHDLVRQKKMFSVSGKRAAIEQRGLQMRVDQRGTQSQKQVLERIKLKNKTPPKVVNYAQMKSKQAQNLS